MCRKKTESKYSIKIRGDKNIEEKERPNTTNRNIINLIDIHLCQSSLQIWSLNTAI